MKCILSFLIGAILASGALAADDREPASRSINVNIAQQPLTDALNAWAEQTGYQVICLVPDLTRALTAPSVQGAFTPKGALDRLLIGTLLQYEFVNDRAVTIRGPKGEGTGKLEKSADLTASHSGTAGSGMRLVQKESSSGDVRRAGDGDSEASEEGSDTKLEEIVVTAQKRVEPLLDVPVPVTSIDASSLGDVNQVQLQDYYTRIPGLNLTSQGFRNAPIVSIRGVTTGPFTNPLVGIVVDDLPYGSTTNLGGGTLVPDVDPSELARIEVLRGPQGTLYGAASMGGLLKYVTIDPSTDAVSGRLQAGLSSIENGDEMGYNVRGSVNVPLSDTFAVRASAFTRSDSGYIDNTTAGIDGVNSGDARGGRLSALWRPSEGLSIKLAAMLQESDTDGSVFNAVGPGFGDLEQSSIPGSGWTERKSQIYSATLNANLGRADLIAVSGYGVNHFADSIDLSELFGAPVERTEDNETTKFTQEIRLAMPLGERVDWLVGAFYADEESDYHQFNRFVDSNTGEVILLLNQATFPSTFEEYAAFTDFTFQITDRFDVQVGGRGSRNRQSYEHTVTGNVNLFNPRTTIEDDAFTYLLTPRFKVTPDFMAYARLASGYRPGSFALFASLFGVPAASQPDKTQNYEIGIKATALERRLTLDASVYYIDWKDIQVAVFDFDAQSEYFVNSSRAKSQGAELALELRPRTGLTIAAWAAWNDAELTDPLPSNSPVAGSPGDRLPFSSPFSGNLSLEQEIPVADRWTGFLGAAVSYVDDRESVFVGAGSRQHLPSYTKLDLSAGIRSDSWTVNLFVNNAGDKRGVLSGGEGTFFPNSFTYIQPRTFGLTLSRSF